MAAHTMDRDSPILRNVGRRSSAGAQGMLWQAPTQMQALSVLLSKQFLIQRVFLLWFFASVIYD